MTLYLSLAAVCFYVLSVCAAVFSNRKRYSLLFISLGFTLAFIAGYIPWQNLPFIALIPLVTRYYFKSQGLVQQWLRGLLFFLMGLVVYFVLIPTNSHFIFATDVVLSPGALPYTFGFMFELPLLGLAVLLFGFDKAPTKEQWGRIGRLLLRLIPVMLLVVTSFAVFIDYVRFDPKLTSLFLSWSVANLFMVCIAEEAIFRRFFQDLFRETFKQFKYGDYAAIAIAALLFGIAHIAGGMKYVFLASIAGAFYGFAYYKTGRLEASILTHYIMNAFHFLFFTYPVLASAL